MDREGLERDMERLRLGGDYHQHHSLYPEDDDVHGVYDDTAWEQQQQREEEWALREARERAREMEREREWTAPMGSGGIAGLGVSGGSGARVLTPNPFTPRPERRRVGGSGVYPQGRYVVDL